MKSGAFVASGDVREAMSGFEGELAEDLVPGGHAIPRYLWVCRLSIQRGFFMQYSTAAAV